MTGRADDMARAAEAAQRRNVLGRRAAIALTALAVSVLFIAIPMHSYLQQRGDLDASRDVLHKVEADNERLDARRTHRRINSIACAQKNDRSPAGNG